MKQRGVAATVRSLATTEVNASKYKVATVARRWKRAEPLVYWELTPSLRVHALASVATSLR